jgi:hypothetical protein
MKKLFAVAAIAAMLVGYTSVPAISINLTAALQDERQAITGHFVWGVDVGVAGKAMFAIVVLSS